MLQNGTILKSILKEMLFICIEIGALGKALKSA